MRRRRICLLLATAMIGAGIAASTVSAYATVYAGPKTWLPGWWEDSFYDGGNWPYPWNYNEMGPKLDDSCYGLCSSRVTFIDGSGGWRYSISNSFNWTFTSIPYPDYLFFKKKPYCRNNSDYTYDAECYASSP
jgi:hypothetical protein